jgi:hypothetical protein
VLARAADQGVVLTPDRERRAFARNATVCAEGYAGLAY